MKLSKGDFCYGSSLWRDGQDYNPQYMSDATMPTHGQYDAKSALFHTHKTDRLRIQVAGRTNGYIYFDFMGTATVETLMLTNTIDFETYPDFNAWRDLYGHGRQQAPIFMRGGEGVYRYGRTDSGGSVSDRRNTG